MKIIKKIILVVLRKQKLVQKSSGKEIREFPRKRENYLEADKPSLTQSHCGTTHFPGLRGKQFPQSDNNRNAYA